MRSAVQELLELAHRVVGWQLEALPTTRVVVEVPVRRRTEVTTLTGYREPDEPPATICRRLGGHHSIHPSIHLLVLTRQGVEHGEIDGMEPALVLGRALHVITRWTIGHFEKVLRGHTSAPCSDTLVRATYTSMQELMCMISYNTKNVNICDCIFSQYMI